MKQPSSSAGGLREYKGKRNFTKTREPAPRRPARRPARGKLRFVIQKHAARRLHYDFRLEMDGVLKSWAVPKGIPLKKGEKSLAIHVEDHPVDYGDFEGTIPEGEYGAGTVMVWDTGTYTVSGDQPVESLKSGKIHLTLAGKKLKGEWTLIKTRMDGGKEQWLLLKSGGDHPAISKRAEDRSAKTRRSMKRITSDAGAQWSSNRKSNAARKKRPVSRKKENFNATLKSLPAGKAEFIAPMKGRIAEQAPKGNHWIYEIKFDGIRALAIKRGHDVQLCSRTHKDMTAKFPEITDALRNLSCREAVLDGEIVALEESGRSSFQLLQVAHMTSQERPHLCYYAFDLLNLDGHTLKNLPLARRKEILQQLLDGQADPLRFSASITGDPQALLSEIKRMGLEGIIAKDVNSKYETGRRSGAWLKIKSFNTQEFVIGGYTSPKGSRQHFGAILVGYYEGGQLMFASKVGTGFDTRLLDTLYKQFQKLKRPSCPFMNLPEKRSGRWGQGLTATEMKRCTWIQPKLVCQVRFSEWTRDNHLRQPSFLGLREDKRPEEVIREPSVGA